MNVGRYDQLRILCQRPLTMAFGSVMVQVGYVRLRLVDSVNIYLTLDSTIPWTQKMKKWDHAGSPFPTEF